MEKRWRINADDSELGIALQKELKIHPTLCRILTQRGITDYNTAHRFFVPSLSDLHDPFLMKDMDKAVARILQAFESNEKILVFGDYDVDGTTSVACMYSFLRRLHPFVEFYIPHRYREGYGVSRAGIDFAKEHGQTLIIALDCGIKSVQLIADAKDMGIDFIVCDHHLPDETLPPAAAILNPKQPGCSYPYKDLCGCGVGYKLITALSDALNLDREIAEGYLDMVATAIAADIVPLTGENRILAHHGLKKANNNPNFGIRALAYLSKFDKELHIQNLVFIIAPRVNAAGRMDEGRKAVLLFVASDYGEALHWAEQLQEDNTSRKEADMSITEEALQIIRQDSNAANRNTTVLYKPHWHKGVVGIVASRLIDHYYRPTIILTDSGDHVAGSARSVSGFNVYEAVHQCREFLLGYGGHFYAAGVTLEPQNVDRFREKFESVVSASITSEMLVPEVVIDSELHFSDIRKPFYDILCRMEPFGPDNQKPAFVARRVYDTGASKIVKDHHIRFVLQQDGLRFSGIGFNMADKMIILQRGPVDVVFTIEENEWNGETKMQLKVVDVKASR